MKQTTILQVLVAEHLHSLGHRHIAFLTTTITPDVSLAMRYQRLKAIQNTYAKLCANEPYDVIVREQKVDSQYERNHLSLEYDVGYQLCMDCLEDRGLSGITAFVGNNDMVAYGIMDAVLKKGYKIPRDFSVCSFDNDFPSGLLPVSLTTVEHYMEEKGRKAFDTIYQKSSGMKLRSKKPILYPNRVQALSHCQRFDQPRKAAEEINIIERTFP